MVAIIHFQITDATYLGRIPSSKYTFKTFPVIQLHFLFSDEVSSAGGVVHGGHHPRQEANYQNITSEERNVVFRTEYFGMNRW